jgi:hypothetical protein
MKASSIDAADDRLPLMQQHLHLSHVRKPVAEMKYSVQGPHVASSWSNAEFDSIGMGGLKRIGAMRTGVRMMVRARK